MIKDSIYNAVEDFAEKKFGSNNRVALHLLYGFAKLMTMDKGVLNVLFSSEEEQHELMNISKLLNDREVDVELLKQAIPLLLGNRSMSEEANELAEILKPLSQDEGNHSASEVLQLIFDKNIPELGLVKKGHSLDDIFSYIGQYKGQVSGQKSVSGEEKRAVEEKGAGKSESEESSSGQAQSTDEEWSPTVKREKFQILTSKTTQLYERLMRKIMGQNEAVHMFAQGYFQSEVLREEETERKGPGASFLFAGPPGVGKTYLASEAAGFLGLPFLRIDMSEYCRESSVQKLTGVPKTYAAPKAGILTGFVEENPRCVVLMDEIEKAYEDVIYQFLQVLDGGILTDGFTERTVNFQDAILIFTTNVGKSLYEARDRINLSSLPKAVVIKAIEGEKDSYGRSKLPAAMCSRFASGNLIMFNHLGVHNLLDIINDRFSMYARKIEHLYGYNVEIDEKLAPMLLFAQSTGMDARNISAQSIMLLKNEMYEFGRHISDIKQSLLKLEKIHFKVKPSEETTVSELFSNESVSCILYVGDESDLRGVPFSEKCRIQAAGNRREAKDILACQDIAFVMIDPAYKPLDGLDVYLSLDDRKSEGILAFEEITEKLPQIPVFLLEKEEIKSEDRSLFLERGARGFVRMTDKVDFSNNIAKICDRMYLQQKVDELSGRGRVLSYNTAQKFSEDGTKAELIFYDFKIKVAADAEENKMLLSDSERPKDRFQDVIGAENAKSELEYFVNYMKNPKKYMLKSIKPPKGILLYGPPGTGKTMLARAMAGECDVTFLPTTAAGFQDKYIGEGEKKIRDLFRVAKKFAPSIIFIDEIDAIGKERTGSTSTHHTESLLNTLLTEMDGFEVNESKPVFVVAATNYDLDGTTSGKAAKMDPALLRRFDNRIYVDLPKEKEREKFLKLQIEKAGYADISDKVIHNVAQRTTGESLAILKNILELAFRNAGRLGQEPRDEHVLNALEEYMYGEEKEWSERYYKSVSIHESGHAYVCSLSGEKPSYITIVSRGNFGGYMQHENSEKIPSYTKQQLLWKIRTALAGRAAELEFFGEEGINTGASSDLQHATNLAVNMICQYGMDESYLFSVDPEKVLGSPRGELILDKVEQLLRDEMRETRQLVRDGREKIAALSAYLLDNNQVTGEKIERILDVGK